MRLVNFLDLFVLDNQILHIECLNDENIYFDGTKIQLGNEAKYDSMLDTAEDLWVYEVEAIDNILYITLQY